MSFGYVIQQNWASSLASYSSGLLIWDSDFKKIAI